MPNAARFNVNGALLAGDPSGALWWAERRVLVVADLHLEKGTGFAARGTLLPPYDTRETLTRLEAVMARLSPDIVISLGDSFHDGGAATRLDAGDTALLSLLTAACDWRWIAGNHDPAPPADWGGRVESEIVLGSLVFRHEAIPDRGAGEISGHFHPKATVQTRARRISGRCFVTDGRRLVLPAFGAYTGGLDVTAPAIARLFPQGFDIHLIGRAKVHSLPGKNSKNNRTDP